MTVAGPVHGDADQAARHDRAREIVDSLGEGFLSVDADWRVTDCNRTAEQLLKQPRADLLGCKLWSFTGFSKDSSFASLGQRAAERRSPAEAELAYRSAGRRRLLWVRAFPLGDGLGVVWRDVTLARAAERRLARSEARHREVAEDVPAATWLSRASGKLEYINHAMAETLGRKPEELLGEGWMASVDPEDRAALLQARKQARADHSAFFYEGRFRRSDGAPLIVQLIGRPRFDQHGAFRGHVGIAQDVTEARAAEARQRVLINELNHRVKNALATVQSLVRQTLRDHDVGREIEDEVVERLLALAAAHDVLTRGKWEGAELGEIAAGAARPYNSAGHITLYGPRVRVEPKVAIALSMALHELATNAVKHGALSAPEGRVQLAWAVGEAGVDLEWREHGGPAVKTPDHAGFGSRLLGKVLARELGAPAQLDYAPSGLVCQIRAPIEPEHRVGRSGKALTIN